MASNFQALDPDGVTELTFKSTETALVHVPWNAIGDATGAYSATVNSTGSLGVILKDAAGNEISPSAKSEGGASAPGNGLNPVGLVYRSAKTAPSGASGTYTWGSINGAGDLRVDGGQSFDAYIPVTSGIIAYGAGDVIGGILEVANAARASGAGGMITEVELIIEDDGTGGWAADAAQVWLFNSSPANGVYTNDTAFSLHADDRGDLIDVIPLDTFIEGGASSVLKASNVNKTYRVDVTSMYAVIVGIPAITPDQTDAITLRIGMIRD